MLGNEDRREPPACTEKLTPRVENLDRSVRMDTLTNKLSRILVSENYKEKRRGGNFNDGVSYLWVEWGNEMGQVQVDNWVRFRV